LLSFEILEEALKKLSKIKELTRGKVLILSIDSKSRSKLWHDTYTN
jgi:hypothetical protein